MYVIKEWGEYLTGVSQYGLSTWTKNQKHARTYTKEEAEEALEMLKARGEKSIFDTPFDAKKVRLVPKKA